MYHKQDKQFLANVKILKTEESKKSTVPLL